MRAITTFSPEGYKVYGEDFLNTFIKHWPIPLTVYFEELPPFRHPRVKWVCLTDMVKFRWFRNRAPQDPENYLYDASKFSCKVFAQLDAFRRYPGKILWLDADIVTFSDVPPDLLYRMVKGTHTCFLGRRGGYSECGFIGFDTEHPEFEFFEQRYRDMYEKEQIYTLKHHTDCHAFDAARKARGRNLTPRGRGIEHVFCDSPLAPYCDHLKGNRKQLGFSPEHPRNALQVSATS